MPILPDLYYKRLGTSAEALSARIMMVSFTVLLAGNFTASGFILLTVFDIVFSLEITVAARIVLTIPHIYPIK